MAKPWLAFLLVLPALAQDSIASRPFDHGWGMALGTGFSAVPLVIDVHYTFSSGFGFYLGGGGTPHPRDSEFSFDLNFNDRGTLRKQQSAGHLGIAVTRHPRIAWGVGFGKHTTSWEVDHGGWFTAEEMARLDSTETRQGPHGWVGFYPGRAVGFHLQAGPGWGGVSLALRFR